MSLNRARRMGRWDHEHWRGGPRIHVYQWWDEDAKGNVIDRGGSYGLCFCKPAAALAESRAKPSPDAAQPAPEKP